MHLVRAGYEHRWAGPIALVVGVAVITAGLVSNGKPGADMRLVGAVLFLAAFVECRARSMILHGHAESHRIGYRRGRHIARPVIVPLPRRDDEVTVASK